MTKFDTGPLEDGLHARAEKVEIVDRRDELFARNSGFQPISSRTQPRSTGVFLAAACVGLAAVASAGVVAIRSQTDSGRSTRPEVVASEAPRETEVVREPQGSLSQTPLTPSADGLDATETEPPTLFLSSRFVATGVEVDLYAVPLIADTGTTLVVESRSAGGWSEVVKIIGPDILIERGRVTTVRIPALDEGEYRIQLGESAVAELNVCACAFTAIPMERLSFGFDSAVLTQSGANPEIVVGYDTPVDDVIVTKLQSWSGSVWTEVVEVPPDGITVSDFWALAREAEPGFLRVEMEANSPVTEGVGLVLVNP